MTNETLEFLRKKASMLPRTPGVYIMKDKFGKKIKAVWKNCNPYCLRYYSFLV